jgi:hypothetical protein
VIQSPEVFSVCHCMVGLREQRRCPCPCLSVPVPIPVSWQLPHPPSHPPAPLTSPRRYFTRDSTSFPLPSAPPPMLSPLRQPLPPPLASLPTLLPPPTPSLATLPLLAGAVATGRRLGAVAAADAAAAVAAAGGGMMGREQPDTDRCCSDWDDTAGLLLPACGLGDAGGLAQRHAETTSHAASAAAGFDAAV